MATYRTVYSPKLKRYVRRKTGTSKRRSSTAGLSGFGTGKSLKSMLGGVKGVFITGGIAAGGAIATDSLFEKIGASWDIDGWQRDLAKMGLGVGLGILIAKILKKPQIAAAFAIGPIVAGGMRISADILARQGEVSGFGRTVLEPADRYTSTYAPFYGAGAPPALPALGSTSVFAPADSLTSPPPVYAQNNQAAQAIYG
jgi:hypothetical protein